MPTLLEDYQKNPVSSLCIVRCKPWVFEDKLALIGDAAHAIVPFYGQGMNCGFEDVLVLDKLMDSLIITKGITHEDFLLGDLNAVMVASRILGYGKDYPLNVTCPKCNTTTEHNVDLSQLETKDVPENDLTVKLPVSGKTIKVRLLTRKIEKDIQKELDSLKKIGTSVEPEATTRLRYLIAEVDGSTDTKVIRETVENMLVRDTKTLREFYRSVTPDVKFEAPFVCSTCNEETTLPISIGLNFFWPDARV